MRILAVLYVVGFFLASCKGKTEGEPQKGIDARQDGSAQSTSAVHETAKSRATGHQAGHVLHEHPNLPFEITPEWFDRVRAYIRSDETPEACPQLKDVTGTDEFERKTSHDRVWTQCRSENERALGFLKTCPFTAKLTGGMVLDEYNFERQAFVIKDGTTEYLSASTIATSGRVWLHSTVFVTWSGAYPNKATTSDEMVRSQDLCHGNESQAERVKDAFRIDLKMPPSDAKALKDKIKSTPPKFDQTKARIQVAMILDGGTAKDTFSCGGQPAHPVPSGRVLAWRLILDGGISATDWISTDSLDPAVNCEEAKALLGVKDSTSDSKCICGLAKAVDEFYSDVGNTDTDFMPNQAGVERAKARMAWLTSELNGRTGCEAEQPSSKVKMAAHLAVVDKAISAWTEAIGSGNPTAVAKARAATKALSASGKIAFAHNDTSWWFGCPNSFAPSSL